MPPAATGQRATGSPRRSVLRGLGGRQVVALDGGLAQLVFLDLAARRHRVLLDKVHVLGDLVVRDVLATVLLDILVGQGGILFLYNGGGLLAVLLVGDAVDLDVR